MGYEKQLSFPQWRIYVSQIPLFLLQAQGETYKQCQAKMS